MMKENNFSKAIEDALTDEYLNLIPQVEDHQFSRKFQRKMSQLIKRREKPYYKFINTFGKRVACVVVIFVFLSVITVMGVDALREKVFEFFVTTFSQFSTVEYDTQNKEYPTTIKKVYTIGYDLKDYSVSDEYISEVLVDIVYIKDTTIIYFSQQVKTNYDINYNTENTDIEEITINNWNGIYFKDNHDYNSVVLDIDDYIITICANLPKEQVINIAKTVRFVE